MENHHAINGNIHYFYGHFQLLFVCSPEGNPDFAPKTRSQSHSATAGVSDISPSSDQRLLLRAPESGVSKDATVPADGAEAG